MPFRFRASVTVVCLAIAVFAVVVPMTDLVVPPAVVTPQWMFVPPLPSSLPTHGDSHDGDEQLVCYNSLAPSRAPPSA